TSAKAGTSWATSAVAPRGMVSRAILILFIRGPVPPCSQMTPNPRHLPSQRARSLQIRLNHGGVDPVTAATEASRIFFDSGDTVRSRWLGFELNGYGHSVDVAPLHEVLSVPPHDRLAVQVTAYRTQRGRVATLDG